MFSAVRHRLLIDLPSSYWLVRGCLKLPTNASPKDHSRVLARFKRTLLAWCRKENIDLALQSIAHATNALNAHYDYIGYHNGTTEQVGLVAETIRRLWESAGGLRAAACKVMTRMEAGAFCRYQCHTIKPLIRRPIRPKSDASNKYIKHHDTTTAHNESVFLFANYRETPFKTTWHTNGFWRGETVKAIWKKLCKEWYPDRKEDAPEPLEAAPLTHADKERLSRKPTPRRDLARDTALFLDRLPKSHENRVDVFTYAEQWGVRVRYMIRVLEGSVATYDEGWYHPRE